jgi:hypothetical protein
VPLRPPQRAPSTGTSRGAKALTVPPLTGATLALNTTLAVRGAWPTTDAVSCPTVQAKLATPKESVRADPVVQVTATFVPVAEVKVTGLPATAAFTWVRVALMFMVWPDATGLVVPEASSNLRDAGPTHAPE